MNTKKIYIERVVQNYFKNSYKELVSLFVKGEKNIACGLTGIIKMIEDGQKDYNG